MVMRYFGGGIGHLDNSPQPRNDATAGQPETESGELEAEVDHDDDGEVSEHGGDNGSAELQDILTNGNDEDEENSDEEKDKSKEDDSEDDSEEDDSEEDDSEEDDDSQDEDEDPSSRHEPDDDSSDDDGYGSF
jgi:hypothetical protein